MSLKIATKFQQPHFTHVIIQNYTTKKMNSVILPAHMKLFTIYIFCSSYIASPVPPPSSAVPFVFVYIDQLFHVYNTDKKKMCYNGWHHVNFTMSCHVTYSTTFYDYNKLIRNI